MNPNVAGREAKEAASAPAYCELFNQLDLRSHAGLDANAAVTDNGRVDISINQKSKRLSQLLEPTIRSQLQPNTRRSSSSPAQGPVPPPYIPSSLGGQAGQTPPPKLNVVIQIVGSRGDVQPFVALGKVLKETYGHRVRLATHATFQQFVEEHGLEFFSIGGDPVELMAFMVKHPGLMPGFDALKSGEITRRRQDIEETLLGCWRSCIESGNGLGPPPPRQPVQEPVDDGYRLPGDAAHHSFVADAIIANPPSFAHIHVAEKMGIPLHMMFTMPWSPTRAFPHPLANIVSTNTDDVMTNYVSYALVEMMTWQGLGDVINRFRTHVLDLNPLSIVWGPGILNRLRIPTTYCWSPALIPKPADWAEEISISGFFFLNLASSYTAEPDLAAFLAAGPRPVYIGFGSIVVDNPDALTRMIFNAVAQTGVRALVSKGWGGIGADSVGIPEGVFMLGNCPHDWLFQHVSAVVHHGGAGTSAAGIWAGRPSCVVPFFGDQPFWGSMIARAGAGPSPIPYKDLTVDKLASAIEECLKPETQERAEELGAKMREEKGADVAGKSFHEFLNTPALRCTLAPSRVAVWRVRRTQTRLSALAAAVLVKEGFIKYSDLKLYRPIEYDTEEQPWDPVSAVTFALLGDIGAITMAIADLPMGGTKGSGKKKTDTASSDGKNEYIRETSSAGTISSELARPETGRLDVPSASSPGQSFSLRPTRSGGTSPARSPSPAREFTSRQEPVFLDAALGVGKGVGRIVGVGMKSPMNFCMGLARGFRNAPKLYNDDTVRPAGKITDLASGLKAAGREFGLGFYDGLSGLVTQPWKGAEKEGGVGLVKGFGKGIGGVVLKPAAAIWSIPAYTMKGLHAEMRNMFSRGSLNHMIASRVLQGKEALETATEKEQKDMVVRWHGSKAELKGFYLLKQKEKQAGKEKAAASEAEQGRGRTTPADLTDDSGTAMDEPKTGWRHTRNLTYDQRKDLHVKKEAWKKRQAEAGTGTGQPVATTATTASSAAKDDEFEQAIRASVRRTSRGDKDDDERVERAIRASVREMRRISEKSSDGKQQELLDVTDEEYQALIERAVAQSVAQRAAEHGRQHDVLGPGEDEALRRVVAESEMHHREQMQRDRIKEQVVLEYVMKQSLAEEAFRRTRAKGKGAAVEGEEEEEEEEEDGSYE